MTSLLLLALLVAGIGGYWHWAAHWVAHGVPVGWFVVGAPLAYFAPAFVLVSLWFALAWIWRTPRPPEAQLRFGSMLRLYIDEALALAVSWPLMALHLLLVRDPAPAPATRPIVLIHGVLVNDGMWVRFRRYLVRTGARPVYTINYGPPFADIEHFARQLAAKIDAVCAATGAARVALVGHSMGGLVARAYLRQFGSSKVSRLVTIGTPHHGSVLAWTFPGRSLAQMRPGNAWLAELNRGEDGPAPVPITAIWSRHDSMVVPQASAELACAESIPVIGIGHNALVSDRGVMELVSLEIARPHAV